MSLTEQLQRIYLNDLLDYPATAVNAFLSDRKAQNLSPGTLIFYRRKLSNFLTYCDQRAISHLGQVTPEDIRLFLLWLEERGNNAGGRHAHFRALRALFFWLENEQDGFLSPVRKVKPPRVPQEIIEGVSLADVNLLISACNGKTMTAFRDKALFLFLLDTGVRIAECLALDISDLELINNSAFIRQGKGRKPRMVFFSKHTRRVLGAYLKVKPAGSYLWMTIYGDRLSYDSVRAILNYRSRKAGLKNIPSPHDFRRAFALNMLRSGCDLITLQRLMGHTDLSVIQRYLAQTDWDLAEAHHKYSPVDNLRKKVEYEALCQMIRDTPPAR